MKGMQEGTASLVMPDSNPTYLTFTTMIDSYILAHQGPVVQSVVSLTSSLRVISLTVLAD